MSIGGGLSLKCSIQQAHCSSPRWWVRTVTVECIDRENRRTLKKACSSAPLFIPQMMSTDNHSGMYWQGKPKNSEKSLFQCPSTPQIPHGMTQARTRASAVRDRRLTTWDMARPWLTLNGNYCSSSETVPQTSWGNNQLHSQQVFITD
jgi:hypothetical protein